MNPKEMANLFDVDLEASLDAEPSSSDNVTHSFDKRVEYAQASLEPEIVEAAKETESDIIVKARENAKQEPPKVETVELDEDLPDDETAEFDDEEIPGDVLKQVDDDIAKSAAQVKEFLEKNEPDNVAKPEKKTESLSKDAALPSPSQDLEENPLELSDHYLKAYKQIKDKYPQFVLHDGSRTFKNFYRCKLMVLANILSEFPILNIDDMTQELSEINLRQFINADDVTPETVRYRIDDVYRQKVRLAQILMQCYHQFFIWERELEMLKSKLWKDHELKGSHRREGLTLEHLFDLEQYYNRLKGFLESAKVTDATLRAASDSLSRQLTCLQMKEQIAVPTYGHESEPEIRHVATPQKQVRKIEEEPDSISDGSTIKAPKNGRAAHPVNFGVGEDDEIALLG